VPRLRSHVVAAKERLAEGYERLKTRHAAGAPSAAVCAEIAELRDEVLLGFYRAALEALPAEEAALLERNVAIVVHSGHGRRDVAPYSDVDLMILHAPGSASLVGPLAERMLCDVFDTGMILGHSVRTQQEACQLSNQDATISSSLMESRLLAGSPELFHDFFDRFCRQVRRRATAMLSALEESRLEERAKFGQTVYLLEPNVKRSPGGLREMHLLRWIGMVRYGLRRPEDLHAEGILSDDDFAQLQAAVDFLLSLRNELHFHAGKPGDVLDRAEQLRIAELRGYEKAAGLLPVEQFMRDYFRHTEGLSHLVARFMATARALRGRDVFWAAVLGHRVPGGFLVGPKQIVATRYGLRRLRHNLTAIMELVVMANLYQKPIARETWEAIRGDVATLPEELPAEAIGHFLSLLSNAGRLGDLLRELHQVRLLERFIPAFAHARGLLQFNQYHKYTVDEHSFRTVDEATALISDAGPLGRVYRTIPDKTILHLALLIHDLGKGHPGDHCEVGRQIAGDIARRLGLAGRDTETLEFLVHKHLLMNHLAFRRDTSDEQLLIRFAADVGSPELLRMLFVVTACDLGAVGPGAWTGWKAEVVTEMYHRAMQHLAGESPSTSREEYLEGRRDALRAVLGNRRDPWYERHLAALPVSYLIGADPEEIADDLRLLRGLHPGEVDTKGRYQPDTKTIRFTIGTSEDVAPGIFHKLTGALSSQGLEILSAQINTLADRLVLDRFWVYDPDFVGQPPADRIAQIEQKLVESLKPESQPPSFRRTWTVGGSTVPTAAAKPARVRVDNSTSDHYSIIDVFAFDRRGLLYAIARTLFELGLSVWRAKIGTYLDQVVDVFYVTDQEGGKVEDPARLDEIRRRLLEVTAVPDDPASKTTRS
jgi:[protein-PII] uridylyltransferase